MQIKCIRAFCSLPQNSTASIPLTIRRRWGMIAGHMYIPTQEERYRKAARLTLMLCIIAPSAVIAWMLGAPVGQAMAAFLLPISVMLEHLADFNSMAAASISAIIQFILFLWLAYNRRMTAKHRLTIAITWGMMFALILRIIVYRAGEAMM